MAATRRLPHHHHLSWTAAEAVAVVLDAASAGADATQALLAAAVFFYGAGAALRPLAIRLANRQRRRRSGTAHQRRSTDPIEYNWRTEAAASG